MDPALDEKLPPNVTRWWKNNWLGQIWLLPSVTSRDGRGRVRPRHVYSLCALVAMRNGSNYQSWCERCCLILWLSAMLCGESPGDWTKSFRSCCLVVSECLNQSKDTLLLNCKKHTVRSILVDEMMPHASFSLVVEKEICGESDCRCLLGGMGMLVKIKANRDWWNWKTRIKVG